jgi:nucleotide-binding universal stress UspA family protein
MFEKMLVCLDGSDLAEQIIPYAEQQALRFGSEVHLLHVVEKLATITAAGEPELVLEEQNRFQSEKFEAPAYLESVSATFRKRGVNVEYVTIEGTVGESIITYADQYGIDLIAIATHGRSGLGRAVFGSVADFVLRESGLPILIIKPQEIGTPQLAEAPAFEKILVCLDGSDLAEQIMPYAVEQALRFKAKMTLLEAVPEPVVFSPNVPGSAGVPVRTPGTEETIKKEEAEAKAYLEAKAGELLREKGLYVDCITMQGAAGEVIISYADSNGIDLITLATHGRSGLGRAVFGSVADYVLRDSGLPILVIKPQEKES